jgi:hypothetical protein
VGWACFSGGALILAFWGIQLSGALETGTADARIGVFESAFPVADGVLGAALVASGIALFRGRPAASPLLVAAAAMTLYLGLLDVTFFSGHGLYLPLSGATAFELMINLACLAGGATGLRVGWRLWREA